MKRALCLCFVALLFFTASCQRQPAPMPDTNKRWGTPAATPAVSELPQLPTPDAAPATGEVSDMTLTLPFYFGERTGIYTGALKDSLPNGFGRFTSSNLYGVGWTYSGEWQNGHFHGQGMCMWEDGFMEKGEYLDDQMHGSGSEYYNGVLRYKGGYSRGSYDGTGALFDRHGDAVYTGVFQNGYIAENADTRDQRIDSYKKRCSSPSYDELYTAAQDETGLQAALDGVVIGVFDPAPEMPSYFSFLMADPDAPDHIVCVTYLLSVGEAGPTVGQSVGVWGSADTLYTYITQLNTPASVPLVEARSVEKGASPGGFEA